MNKMSKGNQRAYLLTIATNDDPRYFENTEMDTLHHYVDYINVMSYDFFTVSSATTGHHSGLYRSLADNISDRYTRAGIERHLKARNTSRENCCRRGVLRTGLDWCIERNNGLYQPFDSFYGAYGYEHITENFLRNNGFTRYWDDMAKAPYLWNPDSSIFISYGILSH